MITVILPVYNEEKILSRRSEFFDELHQQFELIFVDGKSTDESVRVATGYGKVIESERGRAKQMNCGAKHATGDVLLFLHADTLISADALNNVKKAVRAGFIGGCFTQRIEKEGKMFRAIEFFGNMRAKITKVFYGDQGIFVKKDIFNDTGAFPEVAVMEDVIFSKKLRKKGKTKVLEDKITVSARRWDKRGAIRTVLLYSFLNILFSLKVPPNKIKKYYDDLR